MHGRSLAARIVCRRSPACGRSAQPPIRLTLADAIARGLRDQPPAGRGPRARSRARRRRCTARPGGDKPIVGASAGYTRTNHVDEFAFPQPNGTRLRGVSRTSPTTSVARRRFSGRSTPSGRVDALERAARRSAGGRRRHRDRRAPICVSRSCAPTGRRRRRAKRCGCSKNRSRAPRRSCATRASASTSV